MLPQELMSALCDLKNACDEHGEKKKCENDNVVMETLVEKRDELAALIESRHANLLCLMEAYLRYIKEKNKLDAAIKQLKGEDKNDG